MKSLRVLQSIRTNTYTWGPRRKGDRRRGNSRTTQPLGPQHMLVTRDTWSVLRAEGPQSWCYSRRAHREFP